MRKPWFEFGEVSATSATTFLGRTEVVAPLPAPPRDRILEAGHLYSYAQLGEHHEHGGLLLRRDIHRLFDDGWLAVNPSTLKVDVSASLETYPQYARLHEQPLQVAMHDKQVEWLDKHWAEHRT